MTPLEAYRLYVAIKNHFSRDTYYFMPGSGANISPEAMAKRPDRFFFHKLAKHIDPQATLVAYLSADEKTHIKDIVDDPEAETRAFDFKRRQQALTYTVAEDLKKLPDVQKALFPAKGERPSVLHHLANGNIHMVTLSAIDAALDLGDSWEKTCPDPITIPRLNKRLKKLRHFLNLTDEKLDQIRSAVLPTKG